MDSAAIRLKICDGNRLAFGACPCEINAVQTHWIRDDPHQVASVAQLAEQLTLNQLVLGSSPSRGTIFTLSQGIRTLETALNRNGLGA
jgi:hypothetical protein